MIPVIMTIIIVTALVKRTSVYSSFTNGAREGIEIIMGIFPAVTAIMIASYMLRASGAMDMLCNALMPFAGKINIPPEVLPLALIRPVSGSGSLGMLADILNTCGADSRAGRLASVITGSTETTFYCICVYLADTRVKKSAAVIPCALIGDAVSMIAASLIIK